MAEKQDIVTRLRTGEGIWDYSLTCNEAADEIERLRRVVAAAYYAADDERTAVLEAEVTR